VENLKESDTSELREGCETDVPDFRRAFDVFVVDRTIQLRVNEPSFPSLSHAVTRTIRVPETSEGTVRVYVPDFARLPAVVTQVLPLSFE
jgi:hypothetical protein